MINEKILFSLFYLIVSILILCNVYALQNHHKLIENHFLSKKYDKIVFML